MRAKALRKRGTVKRRPVAKRRRTPARKRARTLRKRTVHGPRKRRTVRRPVHRRKGLKHPHKGSHTPRRKGLKRHTIRHVTQHRKRKQAASAGLSISPAAYTSMY